MAQRFIQAAIPTYKESYVNLPLEFVNKQITQDQAAFDKGAAEVAALSSLNQKMSPWAEEQGYRDRLMKPYLDQINQLSNQLYTTGQVGQVVPQIAKLNQKWTNDEDRLALQNDYDFYEKTYLPWTKSDKYSTAYDEYKLYENGTKTGKWNPNIDIRNSTGLAMIEGDQDAYVNKQLDHFVASGFQGVSGKEGVEIVMVGGVPQIRQTIPGTSGYKVIDPSDKMYGHYYEEAIQNVTNAIMSGQDNPHRYYKGVYNQGDEAATRAAIEERVRNLASTRYFKTVQNDPETVHYKNLPEGTNTGNGGLGIEKGEDRFSITPYGFNETQYDYEGNNVQIYDIQKQQEKLELEALSTFGTAVTQGKDTPKFKSTLNDLEIYTDQLLIQAAKDNPSKKKEYELLAANASTFKEYILANPVDAFKKGGLIEKNLGGEKRNQLKSMIYGKMLDIWKDPSSTEEAGYIEDYMTNYNQSKELDFQKSRLQSINNALADEASKNYDFGSVGKEKGLEIVKGVSEFTDWYASNMDNPNEFLGLTFANTTMKNILPESRRKEMGNDANVLYVDDAKLKEWENKGFLKKNTDANQAIMKGGGSSKMVVDYYVAPNGNNWNDNKSLSLASKFNKHIKDEISKGSININQNKIISETTDEEKNKGSMVHFQEDRIKEWKREPGKLKAIIMASDQGTSDAFNGKELYQIFQQSTNKSKNFKPGADGDIEVSGVSFETDPRSSMPLMYITAKTKRKGEEGLTDEYSTISINLGKYDKNAAKDMMLQMITDDDEQVAAVGAQWFASLSADNSTLGAIGMFFDAGADDIKESNEITFSIGQGRLATDYVLRNVGNGKTQLGVYDENHNFKSFTGGTNSEGKFIDGNDIDNYIDALQLIGFYQIGKVGVNNTENTNNQWSSGGNSDGMGKGTTWVPQ
jgi:hypothetical protein